MRRRSLACSILRRYFLLELLQICRIFIHLVPVVELFLYRTAVKLFQLLTIVYDV